MLHNGLGADEADTRRLKESLLHWNERSGKAFRRRYLEN
jgi:hypothetical protein